MTTLTEGQVIALSMGALAAAIVAGIAVSGVLRGIAWLAVRAWRGRRAPKGWLPARFWLAWWRVRRAAVPADGFLDVIDEARWPMVLRCYADEAGTEAVTDAELEAEAPMGDTGEDS